MAQQRDTIKELSPPWLQTGNGEKLLYVIGLGADAILEKLNQAMRAHMPGVGTDTALVYLGNDRLIPQGPFESNDDYAGRLQTAFEAWQRAGSRRAILSQVLHYLKGAETLAPAVNVFDATFDFSFDASAASSVFPAAAIVGGTGPTWDVYYTGDDLSAPPVHIVPPPGQFDWDGHMTRWWRAWLVIYVTPSDLGRSGSSASFDHLNGFAQASGLTGMSPDDVGRILVVTGAATAEHNGAFRIEQVVSPTVVNVSCGLSGSNVDANDGSISWSVKEYLTLKPAPAFDAPGATFDDPNLSWGFGNPPGVFAGLHAILDQWQSEHSFYPDVAVVFSGGDGTDGYDFSPYSVQGSGNPDETWEHFSKIVGGASVPARVFTGSSAAAFSKFNEFLGGSV